MGANGVLVPPELLWPGLGLFPIWDPPAASQCR